MNLVHLLSTASAMGDPTRVRVLLQLGGGPLSIGQLAQRVNLAQPSVSYHVRRLREAGLVVAVRDGRRTVVRRVERRWAAIMAAFAEPA